MCMRPGLSRAIFYCLLISLLLAPFCALDVVHAGEPQWVEVRSPNFSVATDAGEKRGREVALRFEQMRAVFGTLMVKAKVSLPVPLQIVAFRNTKEMRQVAPLFHGKPTQVAGLFQGGSDRSFIMLDMSTEDPWTVVFHEYAHQLMNGNLQSQTDPWFEEGFAEYFSSIEVDGKQAKVGKVPNDDYLILRQIGLLKIADLFKVEHYSETYNETGSRRDAFYTESGMLVHYLYDNQLLLKVSDYFDLKVNKHMPVEEAMQKAFGMSPAQFDKVLRNYINDGRYRFYSLAAPANISSESYKSRPLTAGDASATMADIHLHSPDYQDRAITEFQEILKTDPNNAAAFRGLGYGYLQKQNFDQAGEYFKRASQADSKDPRVHYYNALLMTREGGFGNRENIPTLTQELETSISLDPDFADSYALLAFAQSSSGDAAKALVTMRKALAIDPRNESYLFNLANLYIANRQFDQAMPVLQSLRNTTNPQLSGRVAEALSSLQRFQSMMESGMPDSEMPDSEMPGSNPPVGHLKRRGDTDSSESASTAPKPEVKVETKWGAPAFLQGTLSAVDCSAEPTAVLTIAARSKTLKLTVPDKSHLILIGTDQFSCAWKNKKVAVNYRQSATGETNVMSLEMQ